MAYRLRFALAVPFFCASTFLGRPLKVALKAAILHLVERFVVLLSKLSTWSCTELFPSPCARQERRSSAGLVSLLGAEREKLLLFLLLLFSQSGTALRAGHETVTKHYARTQLIAQNRA
jgi:hypothetical protein